MSKKIEGRLIGKPGTAELIALDADPVDALREARKAAFLDELKVHGILGSAARAIGISPKTIKGWRLRDAEFDEAVMEAVEEACDDAEEVMVDLLRAERADVRFQAAKFILQAKRRETYGQNVALTHENVQPTRYVSRVPRAGIIDTTGQLVPARQELAEGEVKTDD